MSFSYGVEAIILPAEIEAKRRVITYIHELYCSKPLKIKGLEAHSPVHQSKTERLEAMGGPQSQIKYRQGLSVIGTEACALVQINRTK
jgi:hypothetical protein